MHQGSNDFHCFQFLTKHPNLNFYIKLIKETPIISNKKKLQDF
jgi:hypothetical protein